MRAGAHDDATATGAIAFAYAFQPVDDSRGREIGRRNDFHQFVDGEIWLRQQDQTAVDRLAQVVRRNVGRHADRDSRRSVDEQIRKPRRKHRWLRFLPVVVGHEIDGRLVDVGEHVDSDPLQPAFRVPVCGGRIAVDRTEVALAVDQRIAKGERLDHPHQRLVRRGVAVWVVFPEHVADDPGAFDVRPVPRDVGFMHRVQHAAMHRLQSVTHIGKRPADDHAHRVIEVGMPHFRFEADRKGLFGELLHE